MLTSSLFMSGVWLSKYPLVYQKRFEEGEKEYQKFLEKTEKLVVFTLEKILIEILFGRFHLTKVLKFFEAKATRAADFWYRKMLRISPGIEANSWNWLKFGENVYRQYSHATLVLNLCD